MPQETKGRTLEEIGSLFGDEHVASHWYGISEEEKAEIARNALEMTKTGEIPEKQDPARPRHSDVRDGKGGDVDHRENIESIV